jgi:hypothetical protein
MNCLSSTIGLGAFYCKAREGITQIFLSLNLFLCRVQMYVSALETSHTAEHSPRDLESGCVGSVLALARRMFGIRAEYERRCV